MQGLLRVFGCIGIYKKNMELLPFRYGRVEQVLVQPPAFGHQPADAVAFYAQSPFLFGYGKANPCRRGLTGAARQGMINDLDRKNRKRFPVTEKRINMLLALKPLVCFESITNGANV